MISYILVSQIVCYDCNGNEDGICIKCGERTKVFDVEEENGDEEREPFSRCPADQFINYLLEFSKAHIKATIIVCAHNAGRFNGQFVYAR